MSCELLAGPFPLTANGVPAVLGLPMGYHDAIGLFAQAYNGGNGLRIGTCVFDFDGVGHIRHTGGYTHAWDYAYDLDTGALLWSAYFPLVGFYFGRPFDPILLRPRYPYELHRGGLWETRGACGWGKDYYLSPRIEYGTRLKLYRYDRFTWANRSLLYDFRSPAVLSEAWFAPSERPGRCWLLAAERDSGRLQAHLLYLGAWARDGAVRYLTPAAFGIGERIVRAWYSPRFRVFLALHAASGSPPAQTLSVWSGTVLPMSLSAPVLAEPLRQGIPARVTTTLQGADGDPAPGVVLDWSLAGDGALLNRQGVTDADGVSQNWLLTGPDAAGDLTVTAETLG